MTGTSKVVNTQNHKYCPVGNKTAHSITMVKVTRTRITQGTKYLKSELLPTNQATN
jgi:hypothetical protein